MFEIGCSQALPSSPGLEIVISPIVFPPPVRVLRVDWLRQTLFNGDGSLRSIPHFGRIHQHIAKLHIHSKVRRSLLPGFISDHSVLLKVLNAIGTPDKGNCQEFSVEILTCSTNSSRSIELRAESAIMTL